MTRFSSTYQPTNRPTLFSATNQPANRPTLPPCPNDPRHPRHLGGTCASTYAEEVAHLAWMNGVQPVPTKTGWPPLHRRYAAERLGVSKRTLDRALLRHHYRQQQPTGSSR